LPICLGVAFVLRVAWILCVHNHQVSDFTLYAHWGKEIASGRGFTIAGHPTAYYPIGYPAYLGLLFHIFGPSEFAAKAANVLLYLGIIALAFALAKELFHSRFVAGITAALLAINPNHIAYTSVLLSETLFTVLALAGALLLIRWKGIAWAVLAAGIVFGAANIVRPLGTIVMFTVFAVVMWNARRLISGKRVTVLLLLLVLGHGLAVLPYGIRNYMAMHRFSVVSLNTGMNLLFGNNPYANGTYPNDHAVYAKVMALVPQTRDEFAYNSALTRYAVGYVARHPLRTIKLWPRKLVYLYAFEVDAIHRNVDGLTNGKKLRLLMPVTQGYYMLLMVGCLGTVYLCLRRRGGGIPVLGFWLLIVWALIHMIVLGSSRYHYPMVPWITMYAAAMLRYIGGGSFLDSRVYDYSAARRLHGSGQA